jgi:Carbohydrate/starch-binding module (family 21)
MSDLSVRLRYASAQFFAAGGISTSFTAVSAKVKNIAFTKEVAVLYGKGGIWNEDVMAWTANFGDHDLFTHQVQEQIEECVIRYSADGQTFWDNNDGQNYQFATVINRAGGNVILNQATAKKGSEAGGGFVFTTSWLEGEIYVNNLSFGKEVAVRLSVDGGVSWQDRNATFSGFCTESNSIGGTGVEIWKFKTPELNIDESSDEFRFAVFYRNLATGEVFWDNNFEQNYRVSKADGSAVE